MGWNVIWSRCRKSKYNLTHTKGCLLGQVPVHPNPDRCGCVATSVHTCVLSPAPPFTCPGEGRATPSSYVITPLPRPRWSSPKDWTVGKTVYIPNTQGTEVLVWEQFFLYLLYGRKNRRGCRLFWPQEINLVLYRVSWDLSLFFFFAKKKTTFFFAVSGAIRTFSPYDIQRFL